MSARDSRASRRGRSQELAAYLRKHQIERTTGKCPIGCGRDIHIGGAALLAHLPLCPGPRRKRG